MLGKRPSRHGDEWCVASEDCAFGPVGFERVRDVQPGEMIIINDKGQLITRQDFLANLRCSTGLTHCMVLQPFSEACPPLTARHCSSHDALSRLNMQLLILAGLEAHSVDICASQTTKLL